MDRHVFARETVFIAWYQGSTAILMIPMVPIVTTTIVVIVILIAMMLCPGA